MQTLANFRNEMKSLYNSERAEHSKRFFKTGKGEYGEGDVFYGLSVPEERKIAREYLDLSLDDIEGLLHSVVHEERTIALMILVYKNKKADDSLKKTIYELYIRNTDWINNWDLVDVTAPDIIGNYLLDKDRSVLYNFAKSDHLWKKRISIIATLTFIKNNDFKDTLKICEILLKDKHDLIHKASGWMLREVGKRNLKVEENFLRKHYKTMPRTMLRYAIEKFNEKKRLMYLNKKLRFK